MDSGDASGAAPSRRYHALLWLVVSLGVVWCWSISWHESARHGRVSDQDGEQQTLVLVSVPDPRITHWLPATAGGGALIAGLISAARGRGSLRFLVFAAAMTGMKAVTVGIEWLLR